MFNTTVDHVWMNLFFALKCDPWNLGRQARNTNKTKFLRMLVVFGPINNLNGEFNT